MEQTRRINHNLVPAEKSILSGLAVPIHIVDIVAAVERHIYPPYYVHGGTRLHVLVIYAIFQLLPSALQRYTDKEVAPLLAHAPPDARSIDVRKKIFDF
jgi:hypothetical protein